MLISTICSRNRRQGQGQGQDAGNDSDFVFDARGLVWRNWINPELFDVVDDLTQAACSWHYVVMFIKTTFLFRVGTW